MIKNKAFANHTQEYENWFERNKEIYEAELNCFKSLEIEGFSIEIGSGTGRFAKPLGISLGVEPTDEMIAEAKWLPTIKGVAENLPLQSDSFDWALMVTTICFVNDPLKSAEEMLRILKKGGKCAIGFVDSESSLGREYQKKKDKSVFYQEARFFSCGELITILKKAGFKSLNARQTLIPDGDGINMDTVPGCGKGGFVIITGTK